MPNDDLARLRAEMDQAKEGVKEFAGSLWAFHSAIDEGFAEDQALRLTVSFLTSSLRGAQEGGA